MSLARTRLLIVAVLAAATAVVSPAAVVAQPAPDAVVVGPGTGYLTVGPPGVGTTCSIAAVGHDAAGRLIALTAGHCIARPGLAVVPAATPWVAPIGVTGPRSRQDFGVLELDPARVIPESSTAGVTVTAVGSAAPGESVCKVGQGTSRTCGVVSSVRSNGDVVSDTMTLWGDSGGPLVQGTDLVGIVSRPVAAPGGPTVFTVVAPNLSQLAAGDPGNGFVPVP